MYVCVCVLARLFPLQIPIGCWACAEIRTNFHNEKRVKAEPTMNNKRINGKPIAATCASPQNARRNAQEGRHTRIHTHAQIEDAHSNCE